MAGRAGWVVVGGEEGVFSGGVVEKWVTWDGGEILIGVKEMLLVNGGFCTVTRGKSRIIIPGTEVRMAIFSLGQSGRRCFHFFR